MAKMIKFIKNLFHKHDWEYNKVPLENGFGIACWYRCKKCGKIRELKEHN